MIGVYPGPIDTPMAAGFEMEKPSPSQVPKRTFQEISKGKFEVWPDDFSTQMRALFLEHPHRLEEAFSKMGRP